MAYIRKRRDSYKVEIRKKGHPHINRSFIDLKTARKFARDIESQMERNVFEDYSEANGTTLKDILIKYRTRIDRSFFIAFYTLSYEYC